MRGIEAEYYPVSRLCRVDPKIEEKGYKVSVDPHAWSYLLLHPLLGLDQRDIARTRLNLMWERAPNSPVRKDSRIDDKGVCNIQVYVNAFLTDGTVTSMTAFALQNTALEMAARLPELIRGHNAEWAMAYMSLMSAFLANLCLDRVYVQPEYIVPFSLFTFHSAASAFSLKEVRQRDHENAERNVGALYRSLGDRKLITITQ